MGLEDPVFSARTDPVSALSLLGTRPDDTITPICPLFTQCGGCKTQHLSPFAYKTWKRDLVSDLFKQAGLSIPVGEMVDAHGAGRRRATFHVRVIDGVVQAGFMAAKSHTLVPVAVCPVLDPRLANAPEIARRLGESVLALRSERNPKPLDICIALLEGGMDADIRGHGPVTQTQRQTLTDAAKALDLARLSLHGETLLERRAPSLACGLATVSPPPGRFMQATAEGESVLAALVMQGCAGAKRVADLFSGWGPFTLRLAAKAAVHAVEMDEHALHALSLASRRAQGLKPVTTETRDLFRRPLLEPELNRFDAIVLDPPRAGAEAQVIRIAASRVRRAVMVSCNPQAFARDAKHLIQSGFCIETVTPVDQFRYASHVEIFGVFKRG